MVRSNTVSQMKAFLADAFGLKDDRSQEKVALKEVEDAVARVMSLREAGRASHRKRRGSGACSTLKWSVPDWARKAGVSFPGAGSSSCPLGADLQAECSGPTGDPIALAGGIT